MGLITVNSETKNQAANQILYRSLASEINELHELLYELPEDNVLERMGFEARLLSAQKQLEDLEMANV